MTKGKILAFDIGGTKIAYALAGRDGKLVSARIKCDTPCTAEAIARLLREIASGFEQEIEAVGIATAGETDCENKRIIGSVGNLPAGYGDLDFSEVSRRPVFVENDANAVMWAEHVLGAARGCRNVLAVAIGTGLGLGVLVDGKLLKGKSGLGAEAHFPIARGRQRRCSCGGWDCYEVYASGTALGLNAKEAYADESKTSHDVIKAMQAGEAKAREIFARWQEDVLAGIIGLANIFDPEAVLLFGGLSDYLDYEMMEREANQVILTAPLRICRAGLGHDAALSGAALIAAAKLKG